MINTISKGELATLNALDILNSGVKLTPMMTQYRDIKQQFADTLVLFRMGDFYELFFEDARCAAQVLSITLTQRGKLGPHPIPMAGIPHHAAPNYLDRLTQAGLKAAICEQVEDPSQCKGIVKREVTQVISPGLPYDVDKSDHQEHHYIACAVANSQRFWLAALDYTTGDFIGTAASSEEEFLEKLALYSPKELICHLGQWDRHPKVQQFISDRKYLITQLSNDHFDEKVNSLFLEKLMRDYRRDQVLQLNKPILPALAALAFYICSTQRRENYHHIRPFRIEQEEGKLKIGPSTLKGIEILPKSKETFKESLLGFFDRCKTPMGSRELKTIFKNPLADYQKITQRQDKIQYLIENDCTLSEAREQLACVRDLERILVKLTRGKVLANDLLGLVQSIQIFESLQESLIHLPHGLINSESFNLPSLSQLAQTIQAMINDEQGAHLDKGNLIRRGSHPERDRLQDLTQNAQEAIQQLQQDHCKRYGINNLKIKHNNVFGYFIEISKTQAAKAPPHFHKKQTLVNCERFTSDELQKLELEITSAQEQLYSLERELLQGLLNEVSQLAPAISALSRTLGHLDVMSTLAWIALQEDFTRPHIHPQKQRLYIKRGWHPLIKAHQQDEVFVPHDIHLDRSRYFALITGPNMAGKTTVMREMAIIQFLAQIGSFVPAEQAELGLCDYLFSRLGASDDIINGQSTFMVEMSETASILRHATSRSFIILDEVGRGTSTYDGMSIAWSLVEFFAQEIKALCLFSTHYHELIELAHQLPGAANLTVETTTQKGEVKFRYRLIEGGAQDSFGLYVAKLAGLPRQVLKRGGEILQQLEKQQRPSHTHQQLSLFDLPPKSSEEGAFAAPPHLVQLESDIKNIDITGITPLEALQKLHHLKSSLAHPHH